MDAVVASYQYDFRVPYSKQIDLIHLANHDAFHDSEWHSHKVHTAAPCSAHHHPAGSCRTFAPHPHCSAKGTRLGPTNLFWAFCGILVTVVLTAPQNLAAIFFPHWFSVVDIGFCVFDWLPFFCCSVEWLFVNGCLFSYFL